MHIGCQCFKPGMIADPLSLRKRADPPSICSHATIDHGHFGLTNSQARALDCIDLGQASKTHKSLLFTPVYLIISVFP